MLPGVTVEASSNVLPTPRTTVTGANGEYRLPALPPGEYTVKFELSGMQPYPRRPQVQLNSDTVVEATLGVGGVTETVDVQATASIVDTQLGRDQERCLGRADPFDAGRPGVP